MKLIILLPASKSPDKLLRTAIILLLLVSAAAIFIAPFAMPDDYSWVANVISESAAQGVAGAWIAKLGFITFGFAVICLSVWKKVAWARGAYWLHLAFAIFMIATVAFSHKPWVEGVPYDEMEDMLHSFTATAMGFAFSFGVLVRFFQRDEKAKYRKGLDLLALVVATVAPLIGWQMSAIDGFVQRILFGIAYLWYGAEALTGQNGKISSSNRS